MQIRQLKACLRNHNYDFSAMQARGQTGRVSGWRRARRSMGACAFGSLRNTSACDGLAVVRSFKLKFNRDIQMKFGESLAVCFSKYANFSGRASRSEYWWFALFVTVLTYGSMYLDSEGTIFLIIYIGLFLPSFSVASRRLHDTGRSGWWQLLAFTVIGLIPLIFWLASQGNTDENKYGSSP